MKLYKVWHSTWTQSQRWYGTEQDATRWRLQLHLLVEEVTG